MIRSHTCGELRASDVGQEVTLAGWVHRVRDHGGLKFLDLRDRYGMTQVVLDENEDREVFEAADSVGLEWVVAVTGVVRARPEGQENPDMKTGEIEVVGLSLQVLNPARVPPFEVSRDDLTVDESLRLKYRYLDLRRARMQRNLAIRHEVTKYVRYYLDDRGFLDVETPILIRSTPEGARDFLVPSRLHPGRFYALPQSPQQLKQLLMVSGADRYYQIARCFRDEDLRADRQLEFTQLDIEMSFIEEEDIMALNEAMMLGLAETVAPELRILASPFPRITFSDAMARYGTDKPDLRFGLEIADISAEVASSEFRVFASTVARGDVVRALAVEHLFSRREIEELEEMAKNNGAGGLAWLAFEGTDVRGSVARFLSTEELEAIQNRAGAGADSTVFIVAGDASMAATVLGRLRLELGRRLELIPRGMLAFCWIIDPPLVEWNADEERWDPMHHPFTAPQVRDMPQLESDPGAVRARAYDLVCNGYELGGGSIRIHDPAVQAGVLESIGISTDEVRAQFGHLIDALGYGAPPHGGIAYGFDRIVMVLAEEPSIREVIAFPKSLSGVDPMTQSPSPAPVDALAELNIAVTTGD